MFPFYVRFNIELVIYTSGRDLSEKFYLIFLELSGSETEMSEKRVQELDTGLQHQCEQYRACRESQAQGLPHVIVVKPGTFQKMEAYIIAHTAALYNQYKIPRKIYNPILRFMVDGDIQNVRKISV
ncbi:uncharacterized protein [Amphiura filiformis]|uniref:uncharacterized protein n=1 Tax=Amphiura filiformis TaxID=82378 RepID=UPI003B222319